MVRSMPEDIEEFVEQLSSLCNEFIDEERLSESAILKALRERASWYAPIRKKRLTMKQSIEYAMKMSDKELNKLPDDKKKIIMDLRKAVKEKLK